MKTSRQITYNTIGTTVTLAFQWLIMMLIPKVTDFSDAGIFAIALSICSIFNIVATFFINQYQIADQYQKYSENDYFLCRVFTIVLSFAFCAVTIVVLGYSVKQGLAILAYMLYRNFLHFAYLHTATLQIEERLDFAGKCMILEGVVSFVSFMAAYILTKDLVIATFVMAILGGGAFLLSVDWGYRKTVGRGYPMKFKNWKVLRPMMALGAPLLISGIAPNIITALPKLTLQMFWGDEIVGIFSTLTAPTIVIPTLVAGVFAPFIVYFSNLAKSGDMTTIRRKYLKVVLLTLGFGAVSLVASLLLAEPVFKLLYGEYIVPYVWYFNILVIGITLYSVGMCGITTLITKDQGKEAAISTLIGLIAAFVIFLVTIPKYGFDAATFGLVGAYGIFGLVISLFVLFSPLKNMSGTDE